MTSSTCKWNGGMEEDMSPSFLPTTCPNERGRYYGMAIELNNIGVRLFQEKRHGLAIQAFRDAVHLIERSIYVSSAVDEEADSSDDTDEVEAIVMVANYYHLIDCDIQSNPNHVMDCDIHSDLRRTKEESCRDAYSAEEDKVGLHVIETQPDSMDSVIMVYTKPIMIENPSGCRDAELGLILFNMAMSHHVYAMKNGVLSSSIKKAMHLYEIAHAIASRIMARHQADQVVPTGNRTGSCVLAIVMGSLNNLGQIQYLLNQLRVALVYFDELSKVYTKEGCDGGAPGSWSGFWTNLFLLECPLAAPAA